MAARPTRQRVVYAVAIASWLYLAVVLAAWVFLAAADRWWLATLFMFSPRWLLGAPLALLMPGAMLYRPRFLVVSATALIVLVGPVMGLCVPWRTVFQESNGGMVLRVLTCNIHYGKLDRETLRALIVENELDVVLLQGCLTNTVDLGHLGGLYARRDNELVCISRFPVRQAKVILQRLAEPREDAGAAVRYDMDTPAGVVHIFNFHLASPRKGLSTFLSARSEAIAAIKHNSERRRLQAEVICQEMAAVEGAILIGGDFNTPTESAIYGEYWSPYTNAFSTAGWGWGYTFFTHWAAVRIDHILAGPEWNCNRCWVGPDVGSPHRPVIAELEYGPAIIPEPNLENKK